MGYKQNIHCCEWPRVAPALEPGELNVVEAITVHENSSRVQQCALALAGVKAVAQLLWMDSTSACRVS